MTIDVVLDLVRQLSVEEQRILAETINAELDVQSGDAGLSEETKRMIDERTARFKATGEGSTWDEMITAARARWGR